MYSVYSAIFGGNLRLSENIQALKEKKTYYFFTKKQISDSALGVIFCGNFAPVLFLNILKVYNVRVTFFGENLHQSEKFKHC